MINDAGINHLYKANFLKLEEVSLGNDLIIKVITDGQVELRKLLKEGLKI